MEVQRYWHYETLLYACIQTLMHIGVDYNIQPLVLNALIQSLICEDAVPGRTNDPGFSIRDHDKTVTSTPSCSTSALFALT